MSVGKLVAQGTLEELRRGTPRVTVQTPDVASPPPRWLGSVEVEAPAEPRYRGAS